MKKDYLKPHFEVKKIDTSVLSVSLGPKDFDIGEDDKFEPIYEN